MKRPSFGVALAFVYGMLVGSFVLLAFLSLTDRLVVPDAEAQQEARTSIDDDPEIEVIVPVAGVERSALENTWGAPRAGGRSHEGIDIAAPDGTEVIAASKSTLAKVERSRRGGLSLYLLAGAEQQWVHYYGHLGWFRPDLEAGMEIRQGEVLGYVGSSGNASSDFPHLHFEIGRVPEGGTWRGAEEVNPYPVLLSGFHPDD